MRRLSPLGTAVIRSLLASRPKVNGRLGGGQVTWPRRRLSRSLASFVFSSRCGLGQAFLEELELLLNYLNLPLHLARVEAKLKEIFQVPESLYVEEEQGGEEIGADGDMLCRPPGTSCGAARGT